MPDVKINHTDDDDNSKIQLDPRDANTPDRWIKRHPELIRLTGKHPFNCEPPVPLLFSKGFITPSSIHYVRNHGPVPQLSWDTHRLSIEGLVNTEVTLTMDMLTQLPSITIPVTLVCAGNRRKEQNMFKQTIGFNWGPGAVSTAIWKGVLVRDLLLNVCGGLGKDARFVCFDGSDKLPNGTYGTSLSVERALNPMNDVLIAYEMNGARLTSDHGFPVRLIVPGVIGGRMIKFLSKITVSEARSDSWYHYHDNRVLPSVVSDADMAKREQWWTRPEYTINDLNINSAICSPAHGSVLPISDPQVLTNDITISGYAYNGGCKKITRVEVTLDSGISWLVTDLEHPEEWPEYQFCNDPFPRQRYWCWCFWSIKVPVRQLLKCNDIHVRAWDSTMNTQPKDLNWNLMGMMNNCWYRVQVDLTVSGKDDGGLVLMFLHPTVPGSESGGGWMRPKGEGLDKDNIVQTSKPTTTPTPILTTAIFKRQTTETKVENAISDAANTNTATISKIDAVASGVNCYTADEVSKHSTEDDCWIIHGGKVYDCTEFLQEHPGGADSIVMNAGEDCTEDFDAIHSAKARELLAKYYRGELVASIPEPNEGVQVKSDSTGLLTPLSSGLPSPSLSATARSFLDPKKWQDIVLVEKIHLTHNTRLFRFAFGHPDQLLGLPLGSHVFLRIKANDSLHVRAYTPTSLPDRQGHLDLVVKIYFKDTDPRFPAGGVVSQYLGAMAIGDSIAIKGPVGSFTYHGQGQYSHSSGRKGKCLQIGMICGGTGLTPMYQIIQAILADKTQDATKVSLLFGNRTEDDILMRKDIEDAGNGLGPDRFHLWHVLSEEKPEGWKYGTGYLNKSMIEEHLFPRQGSAPDSTDDLSSRIVLLCGPPPMINLCCLPVLTELYGKEFVDNNVFCF
ncbi:nitrate reductase [Linnemannia elongata]|nr:nitrate reductase [Linnemannia elongata]KAH7054732.1 nitrate reductase [Linnemannia elongata]